MVVLRGDFVFKTNRVDFFFIQRIFFTYPISPIYAKLKPFVFNPTDILL